ncbi:MAG: ribulose-phosphate 3-epimerase [Chloroflexota bacterium]|nr:ribulose-phosphate 3-epimerase [Chloroflexota bacterium]
MSEGTTEVRLGAALFNGDHSRLGEEIARIESAGLDFVHLDVFDGHLVPDLGFPPRTIASLRPLTSLPFEVHLAATDPLRFVPQLADAGVDLVLFHVESTPLLYETIYSVREHGVRVGLVLTLGTPVGLLGPVVTLVNAVLLLARVTGEGARGAEFNPLVVPRVGNARKIVGAFGATVDVQVAGGLRREHVLRLISAGASSLALGGGLYKAPDMAREVEGLRALARGD